MSDFEYIKDEEVDEFFEWLKVGVERKWISNPFCSTHDGDPHMTEEEMQEWDAGGDPCCVVSKFVRGLP